MAVPVENFITKPQEFEGFYQAANQLERNRLREEEAMQRRDMQKKANSQFLTNYLDSKDYLTGTAYDPQIVSQLQEALAQGIDLASKGADTPTILMTLGPKVGKIKEYSTKAKLINQQIKEAVSRLKGYKGYNIEALEQEARRMAFFDDTGKLKDISSVDPQMDWVNETLTKRPEAVTSWAGLDDFVAKTPMQEYSRDITTIPAPGKTLRTAYDAKHPFWMDVELDEKGNVAIDPNTGKPKGLTVVGETLTDDKGQPIINPETKSPYRMLEKSRYNAIVSHNPDIKDALRGEVIRTFRETKQPIPDENSPQWEAMARSVLYDELKTRDRSLFKEIIKPTESAALTKVQMIQDPTTAAALKKLANLGDDGGSGSSLKGYKVNTVEAIGNIFNNDPEYMSGERVKVNGRDVIDVTNVFPGGGIKDGRGEDFRYRSVFFDPEKRSLIVEKEVPNDLGEKEIQRKEVKESEAGVFIRQIAEANGVPLKAVRGILDKMGYNNGKFTKAKQTTPPPPSKEEPQKQSGGFLNTIKGIFGVGGSKKSESKGAKRPSLDQFDKSGN